MFLHTEEIDLVATNRPIVLHTEEEDYSQPKAKRKREGNVSVKKRRKNDCGWWRLSLKTSDRSPEADRQCSLEEVERRSLSPPRTSCFSREVDLLSNEDILSPHGYEAWTIYPQTDEEKEMDCKGPVLDLLQSEFINDDYAGWNSNTRETEWPEYPNTEESELMRQKRLELVLPRIPKSSISSSCSKSSSKSSKPTKSNVERIHADVERRSLTIKIKPQKKYNKEPKETATKKRKKKKKKKSKQKQKQEKVPGFRGVHCRTSLDGGQKYFSLVSIKGRKIYLGSFDTPEECAYEYDKLVLKARDHVPKHKINFPERFPQFYGSD